MKSIWLAVMLACFILPCICSAQDSEIIPYEPDFVELVEEGKIDGTCCINVTRDRGRFIEAHITDPNAAMGTRDLVVPVPPHVYPDQFPAQHGISVFYTGKALNNTSAFWFRLQQYIPWLINVVWIALFVVTIICIVRLARATERIADSLAVNRGSDESSQAEN